MVGYGKATADALPQGGDEHAGHLPAEEGEGGRHRGHTQQHGVQSQRVPRGGVRWRHPGTQGPGRGGPTVPHMCMASGVVCGLETVHAHRAHLHQLQRTRVTRPGGGFGGVLTAGQGCRRPRVSGSYPTLHHRPGSRGADVCRERSGRMRWRASHHGLLLSRPGSGSRPAAAPGLWAVMSACRRTACSRARAQSWGPRVEGAHSGVCPRQMSGVAAGCPWGGKGLGLRPPQTVVSVRSPRGFRA